ncbi:hypothetical protein ACFQZZ_09870 [Nocardia sp. GCM10030253]|uniref:hypothetical protein n=1 Tax=Nocardia sp. GCM10030253 TaxID=3273404 RepID=UPI00363D7D36
MMTTQAHGGLRAGMIVLTAIQLVLGSWIMLSPRSFYSIPWVSMHLPYNQHLLLDYGAQNLAMAVVLGAGAATMTRGLVYAGLCSFLVFSALHVVIHATMLAHLSTAEATAMMAVLSMGVVLPLPFLVVAGRLPHSPRGSSEPRPVR